MLLVQTRGSHIQAYCFRPLACIDVIAIRIRSYPVAFDVLEFDKAAGFVYGLTKRVPRVVRFKKIEIRIGKRVALRGLVI